ncbi:MAG: GNAT family N-acetyltransferase [Pseudomonadota bacterium]
MDGMIDTDPESLERATLAAVPPEAQEEIDGWLAAFDSGTVGRAHSAVPLRHDAAIAGEATRHVLEERYRAHGLPPMFRIPELACFDGLRVALRARGYAGSRHTLTQVAAVQAMRAAGDADRVELAAAPDAAWAAAFAGEGFDAADGQSRVAIMCRGRSSVFASVRLNGEVAAVGVGCYAHGWLGVHGMRTAPAFRGRGLGGAVLAALAREATTRGVGRAFLQVEVPRDPALALYRRAGFSTAWAAEYWKQG